MSGEDEKLQVVSCFPGRLRVRAAKFRLDLEMANAVAERISTEPGVYSARASALTGSLLVLYDPRATRVEVLLEVVLSASGIAGVRVDAQEHECGTAVATGITRRFTHADASVFRAFGGKLDLRSAVPGALVLGGFATLLFKSFAAPQWYDLVFWGYVTFNNLNLVGRRTGSNGP